MDREALWTTICGGHKQSDTAEVWAGSSTLHLLCTLFLLLLYQLHLRSSGVRSQRLGTPDLDNYRYVNSSMWGSVLTGFFGKCLQSTLPILPHLILLPDACAQLSKMFYIDLFQFLNPAHSLKFYYTPSFWSSMVYLLLFSERHLVQLLLKQLFTELN